MKKIIAGLSFSCFAFVGFSQTTVVQTNSVDVIEKVVVKEKVIVTKNNPNDLTEKKAKTQTKDFPIPITLDIDRPEPTPVILTPVEDPKHN